MAYFKAIKKAKRAHRSAFLTTATPLTVWTAKKFAVRRPPIASESSLVP